MQLVKFYDKYLTNAFFLCFLCVIHLSSVLIYLHASRSFKNDNGIELASLRRIKLLIFNSQQKWPCLTASSRGCFSHRCNTQFA